MQLGLSSRRFPHMALPVTCAVGITTPGVPIGNWTPGAAWRSTDCCDSLPDHSPWAIHGYSRRRLWDCLHIIHLGVLRDIVAAVLTECLQDGTLSNYVGTANENADAVLHRFTVMAQAWSKEQQLELNIRPLTARRLGISSKAYLVFTSRLDRQTSSKIHMAMGQKQNGDHRFWSIIFLFHLH